MLWHPKTLQNLAMYNVFFIFGRFSIAGKLPKWPKIPFQYPLALRHPKILEKCRKHHRILVSVRNRFWAPPAKADIATAILTNVIEHLVLLLPPNKHAFTAKAVWADFVLLFVLLDIQGSACLIRRTQGARMLHWDALRLIAQFCFQIHGILCRFLHPECSGLWWRFWHIFSTKKSCFQWKFHWISLFLGPWCLHIAWPRPREQSLTDWTWLNPNAQSYRQNLSTQRWTVFLTCSGRQKPYRSNSCPALTCQSTPEHLCCCII